MPKKCYSLTNEGQKEIEISWEHAWKKFTVRHMGQIIGTVETRHELDEGCRFRLGDNSVLTVKRNVGILNSGLNVMHNGQSLSGFVSNPAQKIKIAFGVLLTVAIINTTAGVLLISFFHQLWVAGIVLALYGIILGVFALGVKKHSFAALIIAIILLLADTTAGIFFQTSVHNNMSLLWILIRILFLIYLFQSIRPIKEMNNKQED